MITADRFIARSTDRENWIRARARGITATAVSSAATDSGFREVVARIGQPDELLDNPYVNFGHEQEPFIMEHAHRKFGILPNDWLIAADNPDHMATPDGLSLDHAVIAEAKTTGKDWATPPIKYRRQMQWQMYVTGTERCLLLWSLREEDMYGNFYAAWIEPKTLWIERDEKMIAELTDVAGRLMEARNDF